MKRILNCGCGTDTYGTDFTDKYPQRPEVKKCNQDKDKLPYPNGAFDEVKFGCVIEHLRNPGFAMEEIYRVLKKNSKLFLVTDNANYWGWSVGGTHLGIYNKARIYDAENKHYSLYTSNHLIEHAKAVGFRNIKIKYTLIKAPKKFCFAKEFGLRHATRLIAKFILDRTPFWRMGYSRLELRAIK